MKLVDSYFVTAAEGTTLMRAGKSMGTAVWLSHTIPVEEVENIGSKELRPMLLPDAGKVLRNKHTGEIAEGGWLRDSKAEDWEEIDRPEEEENVEEH